MWKRKSGGNRVFWIFGDGRVVNYVVNLDMRECWIENGDDWRMEKLMHIFWH